MQRALFVDGTGLASNAKTRISARAIDKCEVFACADINSLLIPHRLRINPPLPPQMSDYIEGHYPVALGSDSEHNMEVGKSSPMAQQPAARYRDARYYFKIVVFQASFGQILLDHTRI